MGRTLTALAFPLAVVLVACCLGGPAAIAEKSETTVSPTNVTTSPSNTTVPVSNVTVTPTNATTASSNATTASSNATTASSNATTASPATTTQIPIANVTNATTPAPPPKPTITPATTTSTTTAVTQVQDLALDLVEFHEVCTVSPLNPARVSLDGITSLQCVHCTTQPGVIGKLGEGALDPNVRVTDTDFKQCWSQYRALRTPLVTGLPLDIGPLTATLSVAVQPNPYPPTGPSVKSVFPQFRDKDVMQDMSNTLHR
ncbi:hypothetical protein HGM15179_004140 [Zosterops borbonicus]|uniref:Uncharacterized protein n=1 Tax=Zosterops borbonicus TaxID=364589 RepID=A0A8K1LQF9_9PASS|nr:hypothetical protein HGM15179_004140 [Zosterops borbonicus]